jgi:hypothetical protein
VSARSSLIDVSMHIQRLFLVTLAFPSMLALSACTVTTPDASSGAGGKGGGGNGSITNSAGGGNTSICNAYCTKLNVCDNTYDVDTCTNRCLNANAATLPKLREEIVSSISTCLQEKDCNTVLNKDPLRTCAAEAVASSAPSSAATALCDALAKAATKCGDTLNKAACLSGAKLFNDGAIADAQKCTDKACTDIDDCVDAALGSISSGSPSSSSSSPGGGGGSDPPPPPSAAPGGPSCSAVGDGKKFDFKSSSCDACMASSCCGTASACSGDSSCSALWSCTLGCDNDTCEASCRQTHASGTSKLDAVQSCFSSSCAAACN